MMLASKRERQHLEKTRGRANHDLIFDELSRRLDALWRYDQCIASTEGNPVLQGLWRDLKNQNQEDIRRLSQQIDEELQQGDFRTQREVALSSSW